MTESAIYRLTPNPPQNEEAFELSRDQGMVIVRALSTGDARLVAAEAEAAASGHSGKLDTQLSASAFMDPTLYSVQRLDGSEFPSSGERQMLAGALLPADPPPAAAYDQ